MANRSGARRICEWFRSSRSARCGCSTSRQARAISSRTESSATTALPVLPRIPRPLARPRLRNQDLCQGGRAGAIEEGAVGKVLETKVPGHERGHGSLPAGRATAEEHGAASRCWPSFGIRSASSRRATSSPGRGRPGRPCADNAASATLSITTLNKDLKRVMEPRTALPESRLEAIRRLSEAGIPTGVNVAPVIPGLTDHEMPEILERAARPERFPRRGSCCACPMR